MTQSSRAKQEREKGELQQKLQRQAMQLRQMAVTTRVDICKTLRRERKM